MARGHLLPMAPGVWGFESQPGQAPEGVRDGKRGSVSLRGRGQTQSRGVRVSCVRGARSTTFDAKKDVEGPRRCGAADRGHHRVRSRVCPLRVPQDLRSAAARGLDRERQACGTDLAPRGAEGSSEPAQKPTAVAWRRVVYPATGRAPQSQVELRVRRGPHS